MKICLVSSEFPPFSGGGIGTYTSVTSQALADAGHEVHVIANAWPGGHGELSPSGPLDDHSGGLTIHRIPALDNIYRPRPPHDLPNDPLGAICLDRECSLYWSVRVADTLAEIHESFGFDVVEFPECFAEGYVALARRRAGSGVLDIPMTITLHSPIREIAEFNLLLRTAAWVERRAVIEDQAMRMADTITSPSRLLGDMVFRRLGLAPEEKSFLTIPNSIDLDHIARLAGTARPAVNGPARLLFVGRLEPRKGVRELVDAAITLMAAYPDLVVELIGEDCPAGDQPASMKEHLLRRIPDALQDRFVFRNKIPRDQLFARFEVATACVFAPQWDNFPYTCCEAMAAGGCVVVSDNSGMAEMVEHGRSGMVFKAGDRKSLASTLVQLLDDPALARRLRSEASPRIRRLCAPDRIIPIKIDHYQQTIDRHRAASKARTLMITRENTDGILALLVRDSASEQALRKTVESVENAARQADLDADVTVIEGGSESIRNWLDRIGRTKADYLLAMRAGETVAADYLEIATRVFAGDPSVAWATTWALPVDGTTAVPFAGSDFTAPLDLMYHHPIPFAVIRRNHFETVGGWNLELPAGWREWDFWLACRSNGLRGVVVPDWKARHHPDSGLVLVIDHPKAYEMTLEAIVSRNRELFREHGATLWIANLVDRTSPPSQPVHGERFSKTAASKVQLGTSEGPAVAEPQRQVYFDFVHNLDAAEIDAPEGHVGEAAFFSDHPLGGLSLLAHPPSRITYRDIEIAERSFLNLTISMHPNVYGRIGGGVRFTVRIDGQQILDDLIDAKRNRDHRGWKDLSIDLSLFSGPGRIFQLETAAVPEDDFSFCTAGWGRAHLASDPFGPPPKEAEFVLKR